MRITLFTSLFYIATVVALPAYNVGGQSGSTVNGANADEYSDQRNNDHSSNQNTSYKHYEAGIDWDRLNTHPKHETSGVSPNHDNYQGSKDSYKENSQKKHDFGENDSDYHGSDRSGENDVHYNSNGHEGSSNMDGSDSGKHNEDKEDYDNNTDAKKHRTSNRYEGVDGYNAGKHGLSDSNYHGSYDSGRDVHDNTKHSESHNLAGIEYTNENTHKGNVKGDGPKENYHNSSSNY
ncbi:hypothetical protein K7432_008148 [Basidiobolus ranarum]|uniref:Uncharacterized protein n=1 Tax=Basidiobolus ranarum TaxID=34480 RepID=A0ABR2WS89_9FUNG